MRTRDSGFTLIELMIVVAVIAIIAAVTIPNMLRSRMSSNEGAAVGTMRVIAGGEVAFQAANYYDVDDDGQGDYGNLAQLANPTGDGLVEPFIDDVLGGGVKLGYVYTVNVTLGTSTEAPAYTCTAVPAATAKTGLRQFFVDESGVTRFTADGTTPTVWSTPVN